LLLLRALFIKFRLPPLLIAILSVPESHGDSRKSFLFWCSIPSISLFLIFSFGGML